MIKSKRVAVVGLGNMGLPMVATLARKNFDVVGFDLQKERVALAREAGVPAEPNLGKLLREADIIVASLPNDKVLKSVFLESRDLRERADRVVVVDTSTVSPNTTREIAGQFAKLGHGWLDAPVSGGASGAAEGNLTMMIGGEEADLGVARDVIEALASRAVHVGLSGSGNVAKLINNMLVAAHMLTTAEALRLAESAGVSAEAVLQVVNASTGRSGVSEVHFPRWILNGRFDSGFSAGLMRKDIGLAAALASEVGVVLPVSNEVNTLWQGSRSAYPDEDDFTCVTGFVPSET